ncbi:hypothetical protein [Streptomyces sp. NPDC088707]|uniref:hypothetical protein n=1 Tax=Streptomyces sp. NPDC088707 TaxID=3365871 RepID=UPI0038096800
MSQTTVLAPAAKAPFTTLAVLEAARGILRRDWMASAAGVLRSHRGHRILVGIRGVEVHARALLDDGTHREASTRAATETPAALGKALADIVTGELEGAFAAVSRTRQTAAKVACVAPSRARTTWYHGEARTHWTIPGTRAQVTHSTKVTRDSYHDETPDFTASRVEFHHLTVDQTTTVLRSINTHNRDPRLSNPVYGPLAEQIRAAAPGLRAGDTHNVHGVGPTTTSLFVDGAVEVQLHLLREDGPATLTVWGSMDNQLRAIAAL